jgi:hypothetical protein
VNAFAAVFDSEQTTLDPERIFSGGVHIVNLGALDSDEARNLLSQVLCKKVADAGRRLGPTNAIRLILIVDEAHHISPNFRDYYSIL